MEKNRKSGEILSGQEFYDAFKFYNYEVIRVKELIEYFMCTQALGISGRPLEHHEMILGLKHIKKMTFDEYNLARIAALGALEEIEDLFLLDTVEYQGTDVCMIPAMLEEQSIAFDQLPHDETNTYLL